MEIIDQKIAVEKAYPIYLKKYNKLRNKFIFHLNKAIKRGWSSFKIKNYTNYIDSQLYIKLIDSIVKELREKHYHINLSQFVITPKMIILNDEITIDIIPEYDQKDIIDEYCKNNDCYCCMEKINSSMFLQSCDCPHYIHIECFDKLRKSSAYGEPKCGVCRNKVVNPPYFEIIL